MKTPTTKTRPTSSGGRCLTYDWHRGLLYYGKTVRLEGQTLRPHTLLATAATNALDHEADIAKVQEWLGHANIATTRLYDRRKTHPEESPTFKVAY